MKKLLIMLVLLSALAYGVDVRREVVHTIDESLTDYAVVTDTYYGLWASGTAELLRQYESPYEFIKSKVPMMDVSWLEINSSANVLVTNVNGTYPNFVTKEGDSLKVGGKGFTDQLCNGLLQGKLGGIEQEIIFYIRLPRNISIVKTPPSASGDLPHIKYDFKAKYEKGEAYQYLYMNVKAGTDINTYCSEREKINALMSKGFTAKLRGVRLEDLPVLLVLTAFLVALFYYVSRGKKFSERGAHSVQRERVGR